MPTRWLGQHLNRLTNLQSRAAATTGPLRQLICKSEGQAQSGQSRAVISPRALISGESLCHYANF